MTKKEVSAITDDLMQYLSRSQLSNREIMRQFGIYTQMATDSYTSCRTNTARGYLVMYEDWVKKLR